MIGHMLSPGGTSEGKPQSVQEQEGAGREGDAEDCPGCPPEKMFEHDENGCTQAQPKRQQARGGEPGGVSEGAGAALAVEKDLMVQRRRYEKADTQKYKS
jgi:hypothetical protein